MSKMFLRGTIPICADPVLSELLDLVERRPVTDDLTSSYWREYGAQNSVERTRDGLRLRASAIGTIGRERFPALRWLERLTYSSVTERLESYPEAWMATRRLASTLGIGLTFDLWKCAAIVSVLSDHWRQQNLVPRTVAVIGDGFGCLGALIRRTLPDARLYCIDLPKSLVFQVLTHRRSDPDVRLSVLANERAAPDSEVYMVLPEDIGLISGQIDCAINIASMQEMNEKTIRHYFRFLREHSGPNSLFYCVNRVEKILPGGERVRFQEYPWQVQDQIFIDGTCAYYRHYFSLRMRPSGPRVLGIRVPFANYFDGEVWHRLVHLAPPSPRQTEGAGAGR